MKESDNLCASMNGSVPPRDPMTTESELSVVRACHGGVSLLALLISRTSQGPFCQRVGWLALGSRERLRTPRASECRS